MRPIKLITCSCGGTVEDTPTTDDEEEQHGCGRRECCVQAYQCQGCGVRWVFALEAPEMGWD